ncbi:MAG: hypothetical protein Q3962_05785 [Corynebacterium sp.]|nr:hypothetical protein [Corynebacterium sp.]
MNKKGRITRGFGRMAVASTLALSTTAGVMVAPQMAQVAHADSSDLGTLVKRIGTDTNYIDVYTQNGTVNLKVYFYNPSGYTNKMPMTDMSVQLGGFTYDADNSTLEYQDLRSWNTPTGDTSTVITDRSKMNTTGKFSGTNMPATLIGSTKQTSWNGDVNNYNRVVLAANAAWTAVFKDVKLTSDNTAPYVYFQGNFRAITDGITRDNGGSWFNDRVSAFSASNTVGGNNNALAVYGQDFIDAYNSWKSGHASGAFDSVIANYLAAVTARQGTSAQSAGVDLKGVANNDLSKAITSAANGGAATQEDKDTAKTKLGLLTDLAPKQLDTYKSTVDSASTTSDINAIVEAATKQNAVQGGDDNAAYSEQPVGYGQSDGKDYENAAGAAGVDGLLKNDDGTYKNTVRATVATKLHDDAAKADTRLGIAKAIAKARIEANENLTDDQKDALEQKIDDATKPSDIKTIVDDAAKLTDPKKENEAADQSTKDDAAYVIGTYKNLAPGQKNSYKDSVNAADLTNGQVKEILDAATKQNAVQGGDDNEAVYTEAAKDYDKAAAVKGVDGLLKKDDGSYNTGVREDVAKKIHDEAEKAEDRLDIAKAIAKARIEANTNLSNDQKDQLEAAIDAAKKPSDIKSILDNADSYADDSNKGNVADQAFKDFAAHVIDGMGNLVDGQKDAYKKAINEGSLTVGQIKEILGTAGNIDKVQGAVAGGKANEPTTQTDKDAAVSGVDGLLKGKDGSYNPGVRPEKAAAIAKEASEAATALDVAKAIAKARIEANSKLSNAQKDALEDAIDNAKTPEEVKAIVDSADKITKDDDKTKPAEQGTKDAIAKVIEGMENLAPGQKKSYEDAVKADGVTNEKAAEILDHASNIDQVQGGNDKADASKETNKEDKDAAKAGAEGILKNDDGTYKPTVRPEVADKIIEDASEAPTALDVAKAIAKANVEANPNLSNDQKDAIEKAIDGATKPSEVKGLEDSADKITNDKTKTDPADQTTKDAISKAIDGLTHLVDGQKDSYKEAISKDGVTNEKLGEILDHAANIDRVQGGDDNADASKATNQEDKDAAVKGVEGLLKNADGSYKDGVREDKAKEIIEQAKNAGTALDVAKAIAKAKIESDSNLSDTDKDANEKKIDDATKPSEVAEITNNPTKGNGESTNPSDTRTDDQKKAGTIIDALPNLTDQQKKDFKDRVNNTTDPSQILSIVKDAAVASINGSGMTDDQKKDATAKVNNGDNMDDVQNVVSQYTDLDAAIARANKLLDEAATVRSGDNYTKASDSLKKAYDDAISALQEKYDSAVKNGKDGDVSAADLTAYSDKVEAARDALTPAAGNGGSSLSSGPALWVWILGLLGLVGGVLGWGYVHDADFRAVVDGAIANVQRALGIIR